MQQMRISDLYQKTFHCALSLLVCGPGVINKLVLFLKQYDNY